MSTSYSYDNASRLTQMKHTKGFFIISLSNSEVSGSSCSPHEGGKNRILFTDREWIRRIGIYDYRNRVYSPDLGRFLQTDPIRFDAGDVNLYRYVGNGVTRLTDAMGLDVWVENTKGIMYLHQRVCVDIYSECGNKIGKYCISFGNNAQGGSMDRFAGTGTIFEDNGADIGYKTGENVRYPTDQKSDQKILETFKKLADGTNHAHYNAACNSCRHFSQNAAKQMSHIYKK